MKHSLAKMRLHVFVDRRRLALSDAAQLGRAALRTTARLVLRHRDGNVLRFQSRRPKQCVVQALLGRRYRVALRCHRRRQLRAFAPLALLAHESPLELGELLAQLRQFCVLRLGVRLPTAVVIVVVRRSQRLALITSRSSCRSPACCGAQFFLLPASKAPVDARCKRRCRPEASPAPSRPSQQLGRRPSPAACETGPVPAACNTGPGHPIEEQNFAPVTTAPQKNEEVPAEKIHPPLPMHDRAQPVVAAP